MYKIAEQFSREARQAAARHTYTPTSIPFVDLTPPRDKQGCCPVGVMLQHDFPNQHLLSRRNLKAPPGDEAAGVLLGHSSYEFTFSGNPEITALFGEWKALSAQATAFIYDFDHNHVTNLNEALGV